MDHVTGEVSALSDFDLAAIACGHDPATETGRSAARHDRRTWDLLDGLIDSAITESATFLRGVEPGTIADHIATARQATRS